jgi:hypothetical protein
MRRELPPDVAAYLDDPRTILLVCADRGQHARAVLGTVAVPGGDGPCLWRAADRARVARQPGAGVWVEDSGRRPVVNVRCPRCGRHQRWRRHVADAPARRVLAAGLRAVDIAALR